MYVRTLNAIKTSGFRIDRSLLVLVNDDSWIRKLRRLNIKGGMTLCLSKELQGSQSCIREHLEEIGTCRLSPRWQMVHKQANNCLSGKEQYIVIVLTTPASFC